MTGLSIVLRGVPKTPLAAEFRLSAKQVQGIRIGCARQIAQRPAGSATEPPHVAETAITDPACVDVVVRFLRQQDDVVVPQGNGEFLVNGRFRLDFSELVARANRMRARQGKPEFKATIGRHIAPQGIAQGNGQALS